FISMSGLWKRLQRRRGHRLRRAFAPRQSGRRNIGRSRLEGRTIAMVGKSAPHCRWSPHIRTKHSKPNLLAILGDAPASRTRRSRASMTMCVWRISTVGRSLLLTFGSLPTSCHLTRSWATESPGASDHNLYDRIGVGGDFVLAEARSGAHGTPRV